MKPRDRNFNEFLVYLFLFVGIGNLLMMIDTLLTDKDEAYHLFSYTTSKAFNASFYALVTVFLIYAGMLQHRKNTKKNEEKLDPNKLSRSDDLE